MIRQKIDVAITERMFTVTLTETEVAILVERLKFRETSIPDLTEPVWKSLERALGHEVQEHADL
jgi:hypothetical protein